MRYFVNKNSTYTIIPSSKNWEIVMCEEKRREVDSMSTMKPIQATPELRGADAAKLFFQTNKKPTVNAMKKNTMLHGVLTNIRKS